MKKQKKKQKEKQKKKVRASTVLLFMILLAGLSVLLYPTVSDRWNTRVQTRAVASYDEAVDALSAEDYSSYFEAAAAYNEALYQLGSAAALSDPSQLKGYYGLLNVTGDGMMGYVTVDRINVMLPVYHGTDSSVLSSGAGHLEGSSLPIGGENTHAVISAHRGLPSAKLFTNLDQLEPGDTFTITIMDELYTYEVDQISIIEPTEYEYLFIEPGEDYCTLMTCTPYGINTQRLLVRGVRTDNAVDSHVQIRAEAEKINSLLVAPFVAVPLLAALLIYFLAGTKKGRKKARQSAGTESGIRSGKP